MECLTKQEFEALEITIQGKRMKKLFLLALLAPIFAFSAHKVDRIELESFWRSVHTRDFSLAEWQLNHIRPQCFEDRMYLDMARWYLAWQRCDEQGCVCADIDVDADVAEYMGHRG
jgi:hypothetical protein